MGGKQDLKEFTVGSLPTVIYLPSFISDSEQAQLLDQVYQAPVSKWKSLKNRRLQNWGGVVHEKGLLPQELPPWLTKITQKIYEETVLFPAPINHVLINEYLPDQGIMRHQDGPAYFPVVAILSLWSPVVMNFSPHPNLTTCVHSANDSDNNNESNIHNPFSVLLRPRSLLIFKDAAYSDYLHGIENSNVHALDKVVNVSEVLNHEELDATLNSGGPVATKGNEELHAIHRTGTRVSLTCRVVLKVHKNLFKF
ncbi:alkylated DNA repair protein ALKBH6 homolog [Aristolochia californica]|uniref:alkylated DNA repair protein ALKBH6 homolog n=1 Tax=Aristolochia californica TaxID=171875 RepID=UPI0035D8567B